MRQNNGQILSLFVGNVISLILYGALSVQLYLYYISFPKDPGLYKAAVYIVFITETIYTTILTRDLGQILIDTSNDGCNLFVQVVPVCGAIVALLTQAMYAYRVHVVTKMRYLPWGIVALIVSQLIAIIILTVLKKPFFFVVIIWTSLSLVADTTIAGVMVWALKKDEIHSKRFKRKVTRLVYLIIGTGLLTAIVNLSALLSNVLSMDAPMGPAIVLSKFYANAMMVLVNDRVSPLSENDRPGTVDMVTVQISPLQTETGTVDSAANELEERRAAKEMVGVDSTKQ